MNNNNILIEEISELHNEVDSLIAETNQKMTDLIQKLNIKYKTDVVDLSSLDQKMTDLADYVETNAKIYQ
jgi:16S rRNA C1402 (ribose-2'-O) methylase RsmI